MRGFVVAAALLGLVLSACSTAPGTTAAVTLRELDIDTTESVFAAGSIALSIENVGEFAHTLVVTERSGGVVAATDLVQPGDVIELELDLTPGSYQFSCRIVAQLADGTVVDHFQEGMWANIAVGEA